MKRRTFIRNSGAAALLGTTVVAQGCAGSEKGLLDESRIQHGVIFSLKHEKGSPEAEKFLADGKRLLTSIPVVNNFQVFNQVSAKNDYQYGFSMVFNSRDDYESYNLHPTHVAFVEERWMKEVADFLEIDFTVWK